MTLAAQKNWELFQAGAAPESARSEILTSWRRSRSNNVDPAKIDLGHGDVDTTSELVTAGGPVLLGMADLLVGTTTSLALADATGSLAWRWESENTVAKDLDRIEFEPGSQIAEPTAGTNAIGVTIQTGRPSIVIGAEHYKQPWHAWACVAAPIVHPISRATIGAVNIACRAEDANHLLLVAARSLAAGVEMALREAGTEHRARLIDAHQRFESAVNGPVVTLDATTMIVENRASQLGLDLDAVWSILIAAGPRATDVPLGKGLRASVHRVGPHWLDDGVVLLIRRSRPVPQVSALGQEPPTNLTPLEQSEFAVIVQVLSDSNGKKTEAAARLGISRGTLYQRLRRYRLI